MRTILKSMLIVACSCVAVAGAMPPASNSLKINFVRPGDCIEQRTCTANSCLGDILNFDALHFVFRGQLLSPDRTFEDYGMKDNDPIVPVPIAKGGEAYMNRWINMTGDIDNFQKRVESLLNPNLCPETMRLRDISFTKIEGSARRYRRLMGFFNAPHEGPSCAATPVSSTNLAFAAATRPCCMPMPTPWSQDD